MPKIRDYSVGDEPVPGYRLMAFLGSGGFGEVWKASAPGRTEVALKIINLGMIGAVKEFRSLKLVKNIQYPNLVPILAVWLKDGQGELLEEAAFDDMPTATRGIGRATMFAKTMPYTQQAEPAELIFAMGLGRKSLADRLEECRRENLQGIPVDELLSYMQDAARAIDYLNSPRHELGDEPRAIQHCDIKPPNILIVGDAAQVCDFSLARAVDDVRKTTLSMSPVYAAPEIISTNTPSPSTDQYSLAISYFELRTGELPFPDEATAHQVIQAHMNSTLDLSALTLPERKVIERATARDPSQRYASAGEMVAALRQAVRPRKVESRSRAWPWWAATCVALVLVSLAAALWSRSFAGTPTAVLPAKFVADEAASLVNVDGVNFPGRIVYTHHELQLPFRLVQTRRLAAFYIMENKVARQNFERFARERPELVKDSKWELDECGLPANLSPQTREQLPVFNVTCVEAALFARWLGSEGGQPAAAFDLPSVDQWDAAAGRYETPATQQRPDAGPYRQPWNAETPLDQQVAVNRDAAGPLPVGTATHDVSVFGCRDMAGNGSEWTSSPTGTADRFSPDRPDERTIMICRGHDYSHPDPLRFKELDEPTNLQSYSCTTQDCQVGFRVVLRFDPLP